MWFIILESLYICQYDKGVEYLKERMHVAAIMRRLYQHGLTTCSGGNISLRVGDDRFLITPSALDKGTLNYRQIAVMTLSGKNLSLGLKPSIEADMHRRILRYRSDIYAVVHAHPKHASFFAATQSPSIRTDLLAEARFVLGEPVFAPYALMGTPELGKSLESALAEGAYAALLENHGVLTIGKTLLEAFDRIEVLEAAAEMTLMAEYFGKVAPLSKRRLEEIDAMSS